MGLVSIEGQYVFFSDFFQDYPVLGKIYEYLDVPGNLFGIYLFLTFPNGKFKGKIFWFLYVALGITPSLFYLYAEVFGVEFNVDPIQLSLPIAGPITIVALVVSFWREKSFSWRSVARYLGYALICLIALLINVYLTGFIVYLVVLIYRSNKILTPRERIPTKWVIYGFTVFMLTVVPAFTIAPLFPALYEPGTYYFILFNLLGFFGCGINLTGFLMAVLYANAFDINLVIKRTVVYTALTFLIIGIYLGSVVVLQELVRSLTGQQSSLAVVGATLVAALLFQPLHHAIQGFVDRRFFRRKYNAAQTINILTSSLQNETDLPTLTRQVKAVIDETMQPEMVTVWVRKSGQVKPFHRPEL
jgi:hypothetical protein